MTESFDPYREWLAIDEPSRPLNHYQLLGLAPFEGDAGCIAQAADVAMAKVRKIRPGNRIADWGRLLDQLGAAKVCLLDPASRAAYDASLRGTGGAGQGGGTPRPAAQPAQQPQPGNPAPGTVSDGSTPTSAPPWPGYSHAAGPAATPSSGASTPMQPASASPWSSSPVPMGLTGNSVAQPNASNPQPVPVATAVPAHSQQPPGSPPDRAGFDSRSAAMPGGTGAGRTASEGTPAARPLHRHATTIGAVLLGAAVVVLAAILLTQGNRQEPQAFVPGGTPPESQADPLDQDAPPAPTAPRDRATGEEQIPPEQPPEPSSSEGPDEESAPEAPSQPPGDGPAGQSEPPPEVAQPRPPEDPTQPADPTVPTGGTTPNEPSGPADPMEPMEPSGPAGSDGPADPVEAPVMGGEASSGPGNTSASGATFSAAVSDARFSMAERDLAGARDHLDRANALAKTEEQKQTARRVRIVLDNLTEFWRGMREAAGALQSGQNLQVKDTFVAIVEAGPDALLIRSAGRNLRYRVEDLPGGLVMAVAESWFEKSAASKLLIGAFLCFDARGNEEMGRKMLGEAAKEGVDVKPFLTELQAGGSGVDVGKTRTGGGNGDAAGAEQRRKPAGRIAPMDQEALQQAEEAVRTRFADDFSKATGQQAKSDLAEKLLNEASGEPPPIRIAMLREARRLAVESGRVDLTARVIEALAATRAVDPMTASTEALEELLETARGATAQGLVAQAALAGVEQAAAQRRPAEAVRLADVALAAARNSNITALMRRAAFVKQRLDAMQKKQ